MTPATIDWRALRWLASGYVGRNVIVRPTDPDAYFMGRIGTAGDSYVMELNTARHLNVTGLARTFLHEIGHVMVGDRIGPLGTFSTHEPGQGWSVDLFGGDRAVAIAVQRAFMDRWQEKEQRAESWADVEMLRYSSWIIRRIFFGKGMGKDTN